MLRSLLLFLVAGLDGLCASEPLAVKVVVITTYEAGNYRGDEAGGMQPWAEGLGLDRVVAVPGTFRGDVVVNEADGIVGLVSGRGPVNGAVSVYALGADPRFDFRHTYWLLTALTGFDPEDASLSSALWSEWIVDGDWAHEVDLREAPEGWDIGFFPVHSDGPDRMPPGRGTTDLLAVREAYQLDAGLVDWAWHLTKDTPLPDTKGMAEFRSRFVGYPNAQKPPFVLKGANIAAGTYWHGKHLNDWANRWVRLWTDGKGNMVSTSTPDGGRIGALAALGRAGRVDPRRVLQLHAAMNYSMQPPGMTVLESIKGDSLDAPHPGMAPARDACYLVGGKVVRELIAKWERYRDRMPGGAE